MKLLNAITKRQERNSVRMTQRKKGEQREGIGEVGSPWLMKHVVCHELSSLDFIPPVIKRECIRLPEVLRAIPTPLYPLHFSDLLSQYSSLKSMNLES